MSSTPQFGSAEYKATSGGDVCLSCKQPTSGAYYRINGVQACERCADQVKAQIPIDSHSAFVRGVIFGIGGAIVGLALYAAFGILTGLEIGYVALAVGWLVGTAIKKGSRGIGGRRYQVAAVALTYAAVSLAAIPMGIAQIIKAKKASAPAVASSPATASPETSTDQSTADTPTPPKPTETVHLSLVSVAGALLFAGLTSPFMELTSGFSGIIGLVILFVGVNIAWKITAAPKIEILGPFKSNAPPASTTP